MRRYMIILSLLVALSACLPGFAAGENTEDKSFCADIFQHALIRAAENGWIKLDDDGMPVFTSYQYRDSMLLTEEQDQLMQAPFFVGDQKAIVCFFGNVLTGSDPVCSYYPDMELLHDQTDRRHYAASLDECDLIIWASSYKQWVQMDFYGKNRHRTCTATVLFVIDAHSETLIRAYVVGSDVPGVVTSIAYTTGKQLREEALLQIAALMSSAKN